MELVGNFCCNLATTHLSKVVVGGDIDLQILCSMPSTMMLSSSLSPVSLDLHELGWTSSKDVFDVNDNNFNSINDSKAIDLRLCGKRVKVKRRHVN